MTVLPGSSETNLQEVPVTEILLRRAHIDDVVAWGESLDLLLECKSKTTRGYVVAASSSGVFEVD